MVTISCYNWFIIKLWFEMFIYKGTGNYTPLFQFCQTNDVSNKKIWSEETYLIFLCSQLLYLVMFWRNSGSDLLIHKPPLRWNTDDVVQWLSDLGSWTADYREEARRNQLGSYKLSIIFIKEREQFRVLKLFQTLNCFYYMLLNHPCLLCPKLTQKQSNMVR